MNNTLNNMQIKNDNINQNKPKNTYGPCKIEGPTEGIDPEDIVSNVDVLPGLKCQICFNLVWDPVEIENCMSYLLQILHKKILDKL